MKKVLSLLLLSFIAIPALAQEETLVAGDLESGGFGGPVIKVGSFNGKTGILVGGRGGWIINHTFIIGLGGYGLTNRVLANSTGPLGERYMNLGYGGLELEYIPESNKLVHLSFMALIGAGGVTYRNNDWEDWHWPDDDSRYRADAFFIAEPQVNATLNITSWFRMSGGVSYRFVEGLESNISTNKDLSGLSGGLTFRFGKF